MNADPSVIRLTSSQTLPLYFLFPGLVRILFFSRSR